MFGFGGKKVKTKKGKTVTLLNPAEKASKYAAELSTGIRYTNDGAYKQNEFGDIGLTDAGRAYRSGYLDARKDNAKAYKHNLKKR
ncbi:MAG: hypothetical protein E7612_11290 [Ruminococcaceae bacterium]|nr:hypothetical protein [Oscillospiraceae bacterium]